MKSAPRRRAWTQRNQHYFLGDLGMPCVLCDRLKASSLHLPSGYRFMVATARHLFPVGANA